MTGTVTVNGSNLFGGYAWNDTVMFASAIGGSGTLTTNSDGTVIVNCALPSGVKLQVPRGVVQIGQQLGAVDLPGFPQVTVSGNATYQGTVQLLQTASGTGRIKVDSGGTLTTDQTAGAAGASNYQGTIDLNGGTIVYYDANKDGTGLGFGTLDLNSGTLKVASTIPQHAIVPVTNFMVLNGTTTIDNGACQFGLGDPYAAFGLQLNGNSTLNLIGDTSWAGIGYDPVTQINGASGTGSLTLTGTMPVDVTGTVQVPLFFAIDNANPGNYLYSYLAGSLGAAATLSAQRPGRASGARDGSLHSLGRLGRDGERRQYRRSVRLDTSWV